MLTQAQYDALPHLAREIVDADRRLAPARDAVSAKIVALPDIKFYRELTRERRTLGCAAGRIWGAPIGSDTTAKA